MPAYPTLFLVDILIVCKVPSELLFFELPAFTGITGFARSAARQSPTERLRRVNCDEGFWYIVPWFQLLCTDDFRNDRSDSSSPGKRGIWGPRGSQNLRTKDSPDSRPPLTPPCQGGEAFGVSGDLLPKRKMVGFGGTDPATPPTSESQRYSALNNIGEGHYCIRPSAYVLGCRGADGAFPSHFGSLHGYSKEIVHRNTSTLFGVSGDLLPKRKMVGFGSKTPETPGNFHSSWKCCYL